MANPSVMDPIGIELLKSIEHAFYLSGLSDIPSFRVNEMNSCEELKQHCLKNHSLIPSCVCPVIVACQFYNSSIDVHAMVATGIITRKINGKNEDFVQCKNSYRDDPSKPGYGCHLIIRFFLFLIENDVI